MKKLNKNQWIAVVVSIAFIAFMFYGSSLLDLFDKHVIGAPLEGPTNHMTGVDIVNVAAGSGESVTAGDVVTVHYVGRLENGQVFDSSIDRGEPIVFTIGVGQVIKGWEEGILGMKVGGKRTLTIGPDFGYGNRAIGPIPANSTLIFEVELISIEPREL